MARADLLRRTGAAALWWGTTAAILIPAVAGFLDATAGRKVTLITPNSPEAIEAQKAMWMAGDPVARIYGNPIGEVRVLFVDPAAVIVPEEDPGLVLLPKRGSENPLQAQTVWFAAAVLSAVALAAAAGGAAATAWAERVGQ